MSYPEILRRAKRLECELADLASLTSAVVESWDTDHFPLAVDRLIAYAKRAGVESEKYS